jgi:hypothetical protein
VGVGRAVTDLVDVRHDSVEHARVTDVASRAGDAGVVPRPRRDVVTRRVAKKRAVRIPHGHPSRLVRHKITALHVYEREHEAGRDQRSAR